MNTRIISALIRKDVMLYFRNRFFAFITIAGVAIYTLLYLAMPATVDEDLTLAVYAPTIPEAFINFLSSSDITLAAMESDEALQQAVIDGEYAAGVVLTGDVITGILRGEQTTVRVYFAADAPPEIVDSFRTVMRLAFNELSYTLRGDPLRINFQEQIIGPDMTGQQLAVRNRLLPMLAVLLLVMEVMGLGSLIADEVETGTVRALLVAPVTVPGLFAGKAIFGVLLAFVQAAILMALTGNLRHEPLVILVTLLLGGLVVTGIAFLVASASRGMMSVMAWGMLIVIIMMIPSYGVVFPGTLTGWAQAIPSYYMFDTIHQVVNFGASWGAISTNLLVLLAMGIILLGAGVAVLQRRILR
jgi:ABC-2 type transport system permease protein